MTALLRTLDRVGDLGELIATVATWLLAFTVTYDVVLRTLGEPTLWAAEVSIYLMVAAAFLGAGATQKVGGHFRVTFLRDLLPSGGRAALDLISAASTLLFALLLTAGAWKLVSFSWMLNFQTSTLLQVPLWILQGLIVAGGILLTLEALAEVLRILREGAAVRDQAGRSEVI